MRHANVRNADEVEVREMIKGRHNMRLRQLGKPAGSIALGATLTEVAPSGISFPRHAHYVNEEAIYVLSGSGEARIGGGSRMNTDQMKGNWKQLVGMAKEKWGKLTDNDWKVVEGKRDQLVGTIQERYGLARGEAERQVADFEKTHERF